MYRSLYRYIIITFVQFLNHVPLASGDELSVDYPLFFPAQLPARDFVLKLLLLTSVGNDYQQTVVFNQVRSECDKEFRTPTLSPLVDASNWLS